MIKIINNEVLAVSITEAARLIGVCIRTMSSLVLSGKIESMKVGRRRIVPVSSLKKFIGEK